MTEPTEPSCLDTCPQQGLHDVNCPAIAYKEGVASQAARIAELENRCSKAEAVINDQVQEAEHAAESAERWEKEARDEKVRYQLRSEELETERDTLTRRVAELEAIVAADPGKEFLSRKLGEVDALLRKCIAERDSLTRELAEARERLSAAEASVAELGPQAAERDFLLYQLQQILSAIEAARVKTLDAHRSAKTSGGEGSLQGDCLLMGCRGSVWDQSAKGTCPPCAASTLYEDCSLRPVDGGLVEQTREIAAKTGGLADQTGGLPGGNGPNANNVDVREWRRVNERVSDRIAELERRFARWERWILGEATGSEIATEIRAERAGKGK